jgi:hypothetical protein
MNPVTFTAGGKMRQMSFCQYRELARKREEWLAEEGWPPLRESLKRFASECRSLGARPVLVYLPTKDHVYWPLIAGAVTEERLGELSLRFRGELHGRITANRRALRDLVAETCGAEGVEFSDPTAALEAAAATGRYVFLHHDTHLSPAGHEIVAVVLAETLRRPPPASPSDR